MNADGKIEYEAPCKASRDWLSRRFARSLFLWRCRSFRECAVLVEESYIMLYSCSSKFGQRLEPQLVEPYNSAGHFDPRNCAIKYQL